MNDLGISKLADLELTGHWYSSNSSGWADDLIAWSKRYMSNGKCSRSSDVTTPCKRLGDIDTELRTAGQFSCLDGWCCPPPVGLTVESAF
jgi:hypothetical protein